MQQVARRFPMTTAVAAWITRDNINTLITGQGYAGEVDLFSLDLDGNDYWIWESVTASSPRVLIMEYNSMFGPDRAVTIPYDPQFDRHALPRCIGARGSTDEANLRKAMPRCCLASRSQRVLSPSRVAPQFLRVMRARVPALEKYDGSMQGKSTFSVHRTLGLVTSMIRLTILRRMPYRRKFVLALSVAVHCAGLSTQPRWQSTPRPLTPRLALPRNVRRPPSGRRATIPTSRHGSRCTPFLLRSGFALRTPLRRSCIHRGTPLRRSGRRKELPTAS